MAAKTQKYYDVIIVGSGIAGMLLAAQLSDYGMRTAIVCKGRLLESNTSWAQGGVSICTNSNPADSNEKHLQDTLSSGAGLTNELVARSIIDGGNELFQKLESLGLHFDRKSDDSLELAREGGHSQSRVLHVADATGRAITEVLAMALRTARFVKVHEQTFAYELICTNGQCTGIKCMKNGEQMALHSQSVVLASGGLGQVFERTTNPAIATGDGIALAYRAGARLVDMEFVQFHPTALFLPGAPASLISEAVRGAGAQLLDRNGNRFAFRFHPDGELATRDVVSRAIQTVMMEQHVPNVFLDLRPIGASSMLERFPNIIKSCRNWGIDPLERPIPVAPAAHYFMGGIMANQNGETNISGLYAIGECASTGLHGANRLASNSLLEGGVMALNLAQHLCGLASIRHFNGHDSDSLPITSSLETVAVLDEFRREMSRTAGLVRDGGRICDFLSEHAQATQLPAGLEQVEIEKANIELLGSLIAGASLRRCESRGAHFRMDCPRTDDLNYRKRFYLTHAEHGIESLDHGYPVPKSVLYASTESESEHSGLLGNELVSHDMSITLLSESTKDLSSTKSA